MGNGWWEDKRPAPEGEESALHLDLDLHLHLHLSGYSLCQGLLLHNCFCLKHDPAGSNGFQVRSRSGTLASGLSMTHMLPEPNKRRAMWPGNSASQPHLVSTMLARAMMTGSEGSLRIARAKSFCMRHVICPFATDHLHGPVTLPTRQHHLPAAANSAAGLGSQCGSLAGASGVRESQQQNGMQTAAAFEIPTLTGSVVTTSSMKTSSLAPRPSRMLGLPAIWLC